MSKVDKREYRVEEWVDNWISLRAPRLAPSTISGYRSQLRLHIAPCIGHKQLSKLKPKHVANLMMSLIEAGNTRMAQLVWVELRAALKAALRLGLINTNPAEQVDKPKHHPKETPWWSPDELRAFLAANRGERMFCAWLLALTCGLRRGELCGLRWIDVDLDAGVLRVCNQRQRVKIKGKVQLINKPPKSTAGHRELPIPSQLADALRMQRRLQIADQLAAGADWKGAGYVLLTSIGDGITPDALDYAHRKAIERARVPYIPLHGMRHSMATLAQACGVSIRILQDILGHAHYQQTAETYVHVLDASKRLALDNIIQNAL